MTEPGSTPEATTPGTFRRPRRRTRQHLKLVFYVLAAVILVLHILMRVTDVSADLPLGPVGFGLSMVAVALAVWLVATRTTADC